MMRKQKLVKLNSLTEEYLEPGEISKLKPLMKIING